MDDIIVVFELRELNWKTTLETMDSKMVDRGWILGSLDCDKSLYGIKSQS